jgi:hypothetical protein
VYGEIDGRLGVVGSEGGIGGRAGNSWSARTGVRWGLMGRIWDWVSKDGREVGSAWRWGFTGDGSG